MLRKLLKHDLKWIYKVVAIFYLLSIVFSILGRILTGIENSMILNIVGQVCMGFALGMMISAVINTMMRLWVRFLRNMYKDEAYLTHTLPIEKKTIYLSKIITAIITMFTTILCIIISLGICYYSEENLRNIGQALEIVAAMYKSTVVQFLTITFVALFLELLFAVLSGYIGIILGHKSNNNKMVKSIVYGFIAYILPQLLVLVLLFFVGIFNPDMMNLFYTTEAINIDSIKIIMYIGIGIYVFYNFMYYTIGKKQLEKGMNID